MNILEKAEGLTRPEYIIDIKRIVKVAADNGITLTLKQAEIVWEHVSESYSAGWLILPKTDKELWEYLNR